MLCQKCQKAEATIPISHATGYVGASPAIFRPSREGLRPNRDFCENCAKQSGFLRPETGHPLLDAIKARVHSS